ncbi:shikimate kinase-related protein [Raphidocelis subcapitata]|uniref:Shikimate kinase-related protein n=1 Tax=Raphidocelis subcapitata TaxID=307507 RepID=A0A2V0NNY8_9CHLO|nr:shikimate kinase-related protein [Raphidocelis subcapitata]|eukprot:GBF88969.1 shikimate kinase-related protein [Raphidocelis subcapitata]
MRGGAGAVAARPPAAAAAAAAAAGPRRRAARTAIAAAAADPPAANDAAADPAAAAAAAAGDDGAAAAAAQPGAAAAAGAAAPGSSGKTSANFLLSDSLFNISIAIVGDDAALNWAVAQALAKRIGWFPVSTSKVLCGMHKASTMQELLEREGREAVAAHEAGMLRGMRDQRRCCVATLGDGASTLPAVYDSLHASLIIWLDKAKQVVGALVKGMLDLLKQDPTLPTRKLLYAEMGYRGDWPELKPPNWNPVLDRMGAAPEVPAGRGGEGGGGGEGEGEGKAQEGAAV